MSDQPEELEWEAVRELAIRVRKGEALTLSPAVVAELRRVCREMAISETETEAALLSEEGATALLLSAHERMRDGWDRLWDALERMYQLRDSGDFDGARQQMRDVLAVEVVPHYRNIAQGQLEQLDDWEREHAGKK